MYLSQQIIFHLFNHFKTMFSWWVFMRILFSEAANSSALLIRELEKEETGEPGKG